MWYVLCCLSLKSLTYTQRADHSTAIHVLNDALTSNGACTALDGILTAGNLTDSKSMLIQPLFKAIGDTGNNVYLNKTVNGDKKTLMQQAFGTGDSGAISGVAVSDVNKFFGDEQVKNAAQRLGPKLDRLTGHMITHAAQLANAAINNTMQGTAKSTALAAVNASKGVSDHLALSLLAVVLNRMLLGL